MNDIQVGSKTIGDVSKTFIIAEISANHLNVFENAVKIIKEAKKAGADAVKLQTYLPQTITYNGNNKYFKFDKSSSHYGKTLFQLYEEAYTPWEWLPKLKEIAEMEGLIFFSSVFDKSSVDFLDKLNVLAYKIASFEIVDTPLIEYVAKKQKPIFISTGVAKISDIIEALNACYKHNNYNIILLKCTSLYPSPIEELNLKMIKYLKEMFNVHIGLSDHTLDNSVVTASIALGAKVVERHLTLDRSLGGPDSSFSLEPNEFKEMVHNIRRTETILGKVSIDISEKIKKRRSTMAKSLFIVEDIKKGTSFNEENIQSIRPGYGLAPKYFQDIIGKTASRDVKAGTPLSWQLVETPREN